VRDKCVQWTRTIMKGLRHTMMMWKPLPHRAEYEDLLKQTNKQTYENKRISLSFKKKHSS